MTGKAKRTLLAFLIAPLVPGLIFLVLSLFSGELGTGIWALIVASAVGYGAAIMIGLPVLFVMHRLRFYRLVAYLVMGQLVSLVVGFYLIVYPLATIRDEPFSLHRLVAANYGQIAIIAFLGLFTTLAYWLVARPDRP